MPPCHKRYDNATHAKGENHPNAKLTDADVIKIRAKWDGFDEVKKSYGGKTALAREYGVSRGTISFVVRGEIWKHVEELAS